MAKLTPDWERIEADYRAGILSLREIAEKHPETNHVAISRKAKKEGWVRDLSEKIKTKAEKLVTEKTVTASVTANSNISEAEIIESNAQAVANVIIGHRGDIRKLKDIKERLAGELEVMPIDDENLLTGIKALKDLTDITAKLIDKEREAYNIKSVDKLDITSSDGSMSPNLKIEFINASNTGIGQV